MYNAYESREAHEYALCGKVNCHMPQFRKIMLSYFDFISRHYVKFNAKLKLMTQQSQGCGM